MATTAKKRTRRLRRAGRLDLLASAESPLLLESVGTSVTIEAADAGDDSSTPPSLRLTAYNGGPMRPRVRMYDTGGTPTVVDIRGLRVDRNGRGTPVLYAHDRTDPIGHTNRVDLLASSITAEGVLSVPGASRDKVAGGAKNKFRWAVSVGVEASEMEYVPARDKVVVNGRSFTGPLYIARRGVLREISLLSIGADGTAAATVSATSGDSTPVGTAAPLEPLDMNPELRAFIEAAGFDADQITDEQIEFFRGQHDATIEASADPGDQPGPAPNQPTPPANAPSAPPVTVEAGDDAPDPVEALRSRTAAELQRQNAIATICAQYNNPSVSIQGQSQSLNVLAIEAGWDAEKTELEAMRASRPSAPSAHSTGRARTHTIEAVSAGLMMRCGVDIESNQFRGMAAIEAGTPGWLNADVNADRFQQTAKAGRQFRHSHVMEILASLAEIETGNRPHGKTAILEAAFSTNSIATVFGSTVGARTLMAFREVNDTTAGWTRNGTVPDFEEHGRHSMNKMESLDHLPAGGEAEHAERSAWKEMVSAARFAKQWMVDEQDLIGDRLGLLTSTPMQAGAAAGRLRPDLVYGLLLANPTMARTGRTAFHATDGTLLSAAALAGPALSTAIASLMKQKDGDATLNLQPTHLITGAELSDAAVQLIGSPVLSNDSGKGANNPIARYGITPVADARLSNGVRHPKTKVLQAGSATAWFLVSTNGETIEVLTVEGTGGVPVTRVTNLRGVGKFGLQLETKYDIGANILENRTMRKNAGA